MEHLAMAVPARAFRSHMLRRCMNPLRRIILNKCLVFIRIEASFVMIHHSS